MSLVLPRVHLLTCARRASVCAETLARWGRTDWPGAPRVHLDPVAEADAPEWGTAARGTRLTEAFAGMVRAALAEPGRAGEWLLFLEDDLDFHPQLARHVGAWLALRDECCWLASLFNSGVRARTDLPAQTHAFAAQSVSYLGSQALLLRREAAAEAVRRWDSVTGLQCQRLAFLFGRERPLWVHRPSLVQHVAVDSSWGARVKRAADFDLGWEPGKTVQIS